MAIARVELSNESEKFLTTNFEMRKLHIDYVYEKNSVKTEI